MSPTPALIALTALIALLQPDSARPADVLEDFVSQGLERAYGVKVQRLKLENAEGARWSAWAGLLPTLKASGGRTLSDAESVSSGAVTRTESNYNSLSLAASWTIWDGFANITALRTSQLDLDHQRLTTGKEEQEYVLNLFERLLELELAREQQKTTKRTLEDARWVLAEAQALVKAGAKSALDILDAELQANNAERDLREVEANLRSLDRALRAQLNLDPGLPLPAIDLLRLQPYFLPRFESLMHALPKPASESVPSGNSFEVRLASIALEKSGAELFQTRLGYAPKLSLGVTRDWNYAGYVNRGGSSYVRTPLDSTTISLSFTWTLWDWLSTHRSVRSASRNLQAEEIRLKESVEKDRAELQGLIDQFEIAELSIGASKISLEKADRQVEYSKIMFRAGRLGLLNFQQATSRLAEARLALATRLKTKFVLAAKILLRLGGNLLPEERL